jgi:hypothetical protein
LAFVLGMTIGKYYLNAIDLRFCSTDIVRAGLKTAEGCFIKHGDLERIIGDFVRVRDLDLYCLIVFSNT